MSTHLTAVRPAASPRPEQPGGARIGRTARTWWNLAGITTIWLTSLSMVAIWVAGGGVSDLLALDVDTLQSAGRLAAVVSANLLLYQVLLMARIPLFERGFGRDALVRLHRVVGMWSFGLLVAHLVLQTVAYAASSDTTILGQIWEFLVDYPGMLLAAAGTLLIVLVMVTSARRARRRLRYESWHLLHLYAYLGIALSIPHMLWTGSDFLSSPVATVYWWSLWAVGFAAVLVFRLGVQLGRSLRYRLRVAAVEPDGTTGVRVRIQGDGLSTLRVRPGQFFVFRFRSGAGWTRGHPFSLDHAPTGDGLSFTARIVGDGTSALTRLRPGARVWVEGPYGGMTGELRRAPRLLMIGAGAGVAPLISLLQGEDYRQGEATLLVRDHDGTSMLRRTAVSDLASSRGVRVVPFLGRRDVDGPSWLPRIRTSWSGADVLRWCAPGLERPGLWDVYLCGPDPWMRAVRADLRAAGVPTRHVHSESFSV